mmetsp:Transcript_24394/g.75880  ORF Transcript_24394/g.75880 Transcript_24394/m.75880 type:complete len:291 (-) Transcript_24394:249-1121(-)
MTGVDVQAVHARWADDGVAVRGLGPPAEDVVALLPVHDGLDLREDQPDHALQALLELLGRGLVPDRGELAEGREVDVPVQRRHVELVGLAADGRGGHEAPGLRGRDHLVAAHRRDRHVHAGGRGDRRRVGARGEDVDVGRERLAPLQPHALHDAALGLEAIHLGAVADGGAIVPLDAPSKALRVGLAVGEGVCGGEEASADQAVVVGWAKQWDLLRHLAGVAPLHVGVHVCLAHPKARLMVGVEGHVQSAAVWNHAALPLEALLLGGREERVLHVVHAPHADRGHQRRVR